MNEYWKTTEYAEQQVIGSIIIDPASITLVSNLLDPRHFLVEDYKEIYAAMRECLHPDIISVSYKLKEQGKMSDRKLSLMRLAMAETVTHLDLQHYAAVVKKLAAERFIDYYNKQGKPEVAQRIIRSLEQNQRKTINVKPPDPLAYPATNCPKCGMDDWEMKPDADGYRCRNCREIEKGLK